MVEEATGTRTTDRRRFIRYGIVAVVAGFGAAFAYVLFGRPLSAPSAVSTASTSTPTPSGTGRLPPGQYQVGNLQVLHVGDTPNISLENWTLQIYGEVENSITLSWKQFLELPQTVDISDFHCVTGWSKLANSWEGVRFSEIVKLAKPTLKAKYATIECYGISYTTSLPLEDLMRDDVLFAYGLDGKPLAPKHGGPLRLVVPQKYGYKSAKWVRAVKFTEKQELGYWERSGYSNTADPWADDRFP